MVEATLLSRVAAAVDRLRSILTTWEEAHGGVRDARVTESGRRPVGESQSSSVVGGGQ